MLIDFIAIALIVLSIIKGFQKGFIIAIFSLLAFVVGLAAALKLSAVVAEYLGSHTNISQRWLPILAFAGVFLLVILLVRLGAKALEGIIQVAMLGWLNKLAGIVFYLLLYLFIFSIILFYATQLHLIKPQTIQTSTTYPVIYPIAPIVMDGFGDVLPLFKNIFAQLENFFDNFSKKEY